MTLREFWPIYVREHLNQKNRALHFVGTSLVLVIVITCLWLRKPYWAALAPLVGYIFAWFGHFAIEKNRPATFSHPFKSLACDFIMFYFMLTGQMRAQLKKHAKGLPNSNFHP